MMRLTISAFAVAALLVGTVFWPHLRSPSLALSTAAMPALQELHTMAGVSTLPVQEIEDQIAGLSNGDETLKLASRVSACC